MIQEGRRSPCIDFGFGPKAGSIAALAPDPLGALLAELDVPNAGQIVDASLQASGAEARANFESNAERLAKQKLEQKRKQVAAAEAAAAAENPAPENAMAMEPKPDPAATDPTAAAAGPKQVPMRRQILLDEAKARYRAAINAEIGLVERLVWFWSNHFCVSFDATVMAGAYEREAIRPHVLGRFADMLLAAESHPAMLVYLDNAAVDRPEFGRRHQPRPRPQRESRARNPRAAYARRAHRLHAGRRHQFRQGDHRLDHPAAGQQSGSRRRVRVQSSACTSRRRRP